MFVKICGITHPDDARAAIDSGADAIGINFVETSRRRVDLDQARAILEVVEDAATVMTVGIFRNHSVESILAIATTLELSAVQLHGEESPAVTAAVAHHVETVIKVLAANVANIEAVADEHRAAEIIMLDAPTPGGGATFDWELVGALSANRKLLLAGGLHPGNVAAAVRRVQPWGVDVATGVELASGRKDRDAMLRFVNNARSATPARD